MKLHLLIFVFATLILRANGQALPRSISRDAKVTVIVFLAVDCPISQKYIPTLNGIYEKYRSRAVKVHAAIPGKIKRRDVSAFIDGYGIGFPVERDKKYKWAKALSANATPEVFVFDHAQRLKYRGAIDNWFYELGGYRKEPTKDYLIDAIEALLAGEEPEIEKTKALGCFIQIPM